jgi:hypothetical protein
VQIATEESKNWSVGSDRMRAQGKIDREIEEEFRNESR